MKTDLIVSQDRLGLFTDSELYEWNEAIDEYFEKTSRGEDAFDELGGTSNRFEREIHLYVPLLQDIHDAICHVGSFLKNAPRSKSYSSDSFLVYYFAARTLDTLRTIHRWLSERYSDDIWALIRTVYESYLRLAFIQREPTAAHAFIALAGVAAGTHVFAPTKSGRRDSRFIIDVRSGERHQNYSHRSMVSRTDSVSHIALYEAIYPMLSEHAHVGFDFSLSYFNESEGFLVHKEDNPFPALGITAVVTTLWLNELSKFDFKKKKVARDLRYITRRLARHCLSLIENSCALKDDTAMSAARECLIEIYQAFRPKSPVNARAEAIVT